MAHSHKHAFQAFNASQREGLVCHSRRNFLKASLAGIAGLTVPQLLQSQARAAAAVRRGRPARASSCSGWPAVRATSTPGTRSPIGRSRTAGRSRRSPRAARRAHLRASAEAGGDARQVHDHPLGRRDAATTSRTWSCRPPISKRSRASTATRHLYPAIGSIVAKHHGPNHPAMPPYVAFMRSRTHLAFAGYLGRQYDPFMADQAAALPIYDLVGGDTGQVSNPTLFQLPAGVSFERIEERRSLMQAVRRHARRARRERLDGRDGPLRAAGGRHGLGRPAQAAFDLTREPAAVRDRYGKHLWCQQALLARRLVEAGVALRHDRPQLPHRLRHLGHARRQHPALRRHQERPAPAAAAVRSPDHHAGQRPRRARPAGRRAGDRDGRVRPHAADGHAGQHRRPQSLAGRDVDVRWPAAACGTAR